MKTLSIRQPWADLILQGRKTLELRTWTVKYRGPLAIHASQTVEREMCAAYGIDPNQVTTGAVIGSVELTGIDELNDRSYTERKSEHLVEDPWNDGPLYGWWLTKPQRLPAPIPVRGRMGLFEAPIAEDGSGQAELTRRSVNQPLLPAQPRQVDSHISPARTFDLRVQPVSNGSPGEPAYRLALSQIAVQGPAAQQGLYEVEPSPSRRVAQLGGSTLRAVADHVLDALRGNGYRATDLAAGRKEPFALTEESGVRLGLLFLAVRPITRMDRIEIIAQGIRAMTSEEAYYWYSKCTGGVAAERAQRALRVLLAND